MRTKWLLITLPLIVFGVLAQSAFWVPTYESQAKGNPGRLTTFLRASIGEPKLLNPILSSDNAAQTVMTNKVSEALVEADENLKLVPRLAERWETTEEAYVAVLPERTLPDGSQVTPERLLTALRTAWKDGKIAGLEQSIQSVELVPGEVRALSKTVLIENAKGKREPLDVDMSVLVPERVKLTLNKVDPQLFIKLEPVLGASYFKNYPFASRFRLKNPEYLQKVKDEFPELLGIGEHNPIITFYLRPGVRWHDGVPFTAEDVKFTYQALIDPKNASPRSSSYDPIKSVEVVNELTARVTYKHLYAPAIIDWCLEIIPKHLLDGPALSREMDARHISGEARKTFSVRSSDYSRKPIGTGPWRFAEWLPDQYIHLTRNEDYWRAKAEYRDVYFRTIPDYLTMELEFQAGALDWYDALPHQAERYAKNPDYRVVQNAEGSYAYIGYNMRRPLFQDQRVRRALGMAIDVDSIIRYVLYGQGKRATGPYYSNTPYNDPTVQPLPYDPKAALALLAEAGWTKNAAGMLEKGGKPLRFTLVTNNGNPQRKAIMTVAQEAWRKIGVECKIQAFEWSVFIEDFVNKDNFDAMVLGWIGADIDPNKYQIWHSSQTGPYQLNHVGYQSAEADALMERIRIEYDQDEQIRLTRQLHRRIAEDQPCTFLYEPFKPVVLDKRIARVLQTPDGQERAEKIVTSPSGSMDQFFPQWRKLSTVPEYSAE
ncbi:MAG: ABC transporter substrate-binding protein [Polyangiaceae bacterium]